MPQRDIVISTILSVCACLSVRLSNVGRLLCQNERTSWYGHHSSFSRPTAVTKIPRGQGRWIQGVGTFCKYRHLSQKLQHLFVYISPQRRPTA